MSLCRKVSCFFATVALSFICWLAHYLIWCPENHSTTGTFQMCATWTKHTVTITFSNANSFYRNGTFKSLTIIHIYIYILLFLFLYTKAVPLASWTYVRTNGCSGSHSSSVLVLVVVDIKHRHTAKEQTQSTDEDSKWYIGEHYENQNNHQRKDQTATRTSIVIISGGLLIC